MNEEYEVEINLIEFCKKLLKQWKWLLLSALIGGALVSGAKYVLDSRAAANYVEKSEKELEQEAIEELTPLERVSAEEIARRIEVVATREAYLNHAARFQLDPGNVKVLTVLYTLEAENAGDLQAAGLFYEANVSSAEFTDAVGEAQGLDPNENYVDELVEVEFTLADVGAFTDAGEQIRNATGSLKIDVMLMDDADEEKVLDSVKKSVSAYAPVTKTGNGEVICSFAAAQIHIVADPVLRNDINTTTTAVYSEKRSILTTTSSLSDAQMMYLSAYLREFGMEDADIALYSGVEEDEDESAVVNGTAPVAHFSIKFLAVGIVLGLICYAGIVFCLVVFFPKAGKVAGVGALESVPLLGSLLKEDKKKENENRVENIISAIKFRNKDAEASSVLCVIGDEPAALDNLKNSWNSAFSKEAETISIPVGSDKESERYALIDAIKAPVVLVLADDTVSVRDVNKICALMAEKEICVIGRIEVV